MCVLPTASPSDAHITAGHPAARRTISLTASLALLAGLFLASPARAWQEDDAGPPTVTGKLVEITSRGRTHTVVVESSDGEKHEFRVTGKTDFAIVAPATEKLLREDQYVRVEGVATNQRMFGKQFAVLVRHSGRMPKPAIAKAPKKVGRSLNTYFVSGPIISRQQDTDYPDFETITIKVGGKKGTNVYLDKGYRVTARSNNPELAEPGSAVTVIGKPGRGGRVDVVSVEIRRTTPFPEEDAAE